MKIIFLSLLLTGCASNWADYNYGPGDWLNDNTPLTVDTIYNYQHLTEPTIEIHRVASVAAACGTQWAKGCADVRGNHCDIYVGNLASPATIAHEERHCRGWSHYRAHVEMFTAMGYDYQLREIARSKRWVPTDQNLSVAAVTLSSRD